MESVGKVIIGHPEMVADRTESHLGEEDATQ